MTAGRGRALGRGLARNPFGAERVEPGALAFISDDDGAPIHLGPMLDRARARGGGEIRGRHGTGKSALLYALAQEAERQEHAVTRVRANTGRRAVLAALRRAPPGGLVCIDSGERLCGSWWLLRRLARRRRVTVITTAHRTAGLPLLHDRRPTARTLQEIARALCPQRGLNAEQAARLLEQAGGSVRDALWLLYDEAETRAPRR